MPGTCSIGAFKAQWQPAKRPRSIAVCRALAAGKPGFATAGKPRFATAVAVRSGSSLPSRRLSPFASACLNQRAACIAHAAACVPSDMSAAGCSALSTRLLSAADCRSGRGAAVAPVLLLLPLSMLLVPVLHVALVPKVSTGGAGRVPLAETATAPVATAAPVLAVP